MSLIDFPFVSGTKIIVKNIPTTLTPANIQKVWPIPIALLIEPKVTVMIKANVQLKAPVAGLAIALYSFEYISLNMSHGTGLERLELNIDYHNLKENCVYHLPVSDCEEYQIYAKRSQGQPP